MTAIPQLLFSCSALWRRSSCAKRHCMTFWQSLNWAINHKPYQVAFWDILGVLVSIPFAHSSHRRTLSNIRAGLGPRQSWSGIRAAKECWEMGSTAAPTCIMSPYLHLWLLGAERLGAAPLEPLRALVLFLQGLSWLASNWVENKSYSGGVIAIQLTYLLFSHLWFVQKLLQLCCPSQSE